MYVFSFLAPPARSYLLSDIFNCLWCPTIRYFSNLKTNYISKNQKTPIFKLTESVKISLLRLQRAIHHSRYFQKSVFVGLRLGFKKSSFFNGFFHGIRCWMNLIHYLIFIQFSFIRSNFSSDTFRIYGKTKACHVTRWL